ncbi:MAG: tetratricopeptide repeat protein, partial [Lachnospiraceae bacterium]|nr:tetratricopeptide repeat protein [Lachnospiraceae bacterium]
MAAETCNEWLLADAGVSEDNDILMGLYQKGWLQLDKESYALHPVFAQFIFERYKPEEEKHHGLIEACRKYLEISPSGSALECQKFIPFAENISERLIRENSTEQADLRFDIAYLLSYIAEYKKAKELYKKALVIRERVLGEDHP